MDELTARLESLLRLYAGARQQDQGDGTRLEQLFGRDLQLLVAEFGPRAVDAALDKIPDGSWQPGSLH
jgi:carbon monoxide dehydrogenase subunit G